MLAVIEERPGVSLTEIAPVTGIAKALILSATRAGVSAVSTGRVVRRPTGAHDRAGERGDHISE
jgi:hypothetical protein